MEAYESQKDAADKYSLRGRVFSKLREDILSGKYKEMDELKEVMIGQELGVSRTPVREALRQLELEGLVTIVPNKGAYVTGISDQDIEDIFVIRSYLEGLCAAWACRHITKEQLDSLEEIVYLANFHVEKGNFDQVVELDNKAYRRVYPADALGRRRRGKRGRGVKEKTIVINQDTIGRLEQTERNGNFTLWSSFSFVNL